MFEKEAEERVKDYIIEKWDCLMKPCKTLEDCRSKELEFDDAVNLVKDGAEYGYNKANEWHYVKDGDLPKDEKEVLVYMWDSFYIGYYSEKDDENNRWHFEEFSEESEQVTAWKEIVPPDVEEE